MYLKHDMNILGEGGCGYILKFDEVVFPHDNYTTRLLSDRWLELAIKLQLVDKVLVVSHMSLKEKKHHWAMEYGGAVPHKFGDVGIPNIPYDKIH